MMLAMLFSLVFAEPQADSVQEKQPEVSYVSGVGPLKYEGEELLKRIAKKQKLPKLIVTSIERTAEKQAEIMDEAFGKSKTRGMYSDTHFNVWNDVPAEPSSGRRAKQKAALLKHLEELAANTDNKRIDLQHLPGGKKYAFDVDPKNIDPDTFIKALDEESRVLRCFRPGKYEQVFHIELSRGDELRKTVSCEEGK